MSRRMTADMEVRMKSTFVAVALMLLGIPTFSAAHSGNSDPNMVHACVGNSSKLVRIVGVAGTCYVSPPATAETAMHWPLTTSAVQADLTALQALVATLQGAVSALQTGLPAETAARQAADTTLQNNINAEAAARAAAD